VGKNDAARYYDGSSWSNINFSTGGTADFYGLWGTGGSSVWAVGHRFDLGHNYPVVYQYNGSSWVDQAPSFMDQQLQAVWVDSGGEVFAVGQDDTGASGVILHRKAGAWANVTPAGAKRLYGVWGTGPCDVWAVGEGGEMYHYHNPP
jgi:hypothetical protein